MSKLTDYSKWDNLDSDDECEVTATNASVLNTAKSKGPTLDELRKGEKFGAAEQEEELRNNPAPHLENQADIAAAMGAGGPGGGVGRGSSIPNPGAKSKIKMTEKGSEKGRYVFSHQGQKIYEWEQSLEEVNLYITPPQGVLASYFDIDIGVKKLVVALKGSDQKFIEEETFGVVDVGESTWTYDSATNELNIVLSKAQKGSTWTSALVGRHGVEVDPLTQEAIKKEMMLERFQEENPGFDFRGAEFNGSVPNPREFMGGVKCEC